MTSTQLVSGNRQKPCCFNKSVVIAGVGIWVRMAPSIISQISSDGFMFGDLGGQAESCGDNIQNAPQTNCGTQNVIIMEHLIVTEIKCINACT